MDSDDERPWCATKVDWAGHYILKEWGYCANNCPSQ
jgi:hypothetical protein